MTALSSGECKCRRQVWTIDMTPQCGSPSPYLVHSSVSMISLVDECCILLAPTVLLCHQSNCLQWAVEPSQLLCPTLEQLTDNIMLADSLSTFRRQLKHYLFQQFYPPRCCTVTVAQLCYCDTASGPISGSSYLGTIKIADWLTVSGHISISKDTICHLFKIAADWPCPVRKCFSIEWWW